MSVYIESQPSATYATVNKKHKRRNNNGQRHDSSSASTPGRASWEANTSSTRANAGRTQESSMVLEERYRAIISTNSDLPPEPTVEVSNVQSSKSKKKVENFGFQIFAIFFLIIVLLQFVSFTVAIIILYNRNSTLKNDVDTLRLETVNTFDAVNQNFTKQITSLNEEHGKDTNETIKSQNNLTMTIDSVGSRVDGNTRSISANTKEFNEVARNQMAQIQTLRDDIESLRHKIEHNVLSRSQMLNDLKQSLTSSSNFTADKLTLLLNDLPHGMNTNFPAASCQAITALRPSLPSGYYWVKTSNGSTVPFQVYCSMDDSCGSKGWTRVAQLDHKNGSANCFDDLENSPNCQNLCRMKNESASCSLTVFPVYNIDYSQVCGLVKGYGVLSPDGFNNHGRLRDGPSLSGNYVDGISFTHSSMKAHIWTLVGYSEGTSCPTSPNFIGSHSSCFTSNNLQADECPEGSMALRFVRDLQETVSEDIEMRLCRDQDRSDEDIVLEDLELYVKLS